MLNSINYFNTRVFNDEDLQQLSSDTESYLDSFLHTKNDEELKRYIGLSEKALVELQTTQKLLSVALQQGGIQDKLYHVGRELVYQAHQLFHRIMNILISVTGLSEIQERRATAYDDLSDAFGGQMKWQRYLEALGGISTLYFAVYAIIGQALIAGVIVALAVSALLLMVPYYQRHLKPCPTAYQGLVNLKERVLQCMEPRTFHRKSLLLRIEEAFRSGKGVLLTADPGVGKSMLMKSLAESIVDGSSANFLRHAEVFRMNAQQMKQSNFDAMLPSSIAHYFQWHKKDFVLFADEIESIFQEGGVEGKVDQMFLTFKDDFPYVVCATTTEQFQNTIKNKKHAFMRRFVHIEVPAFSEKEIESALYERIRAIAPDLKVTVDGLSYLMQKAGEDKTTSQIEAAFSLLEVALDRLSLASQDINTSLYISTLEEQIASLANKVLSTRDQMNIDAYNELRQRITQEHQKAQEMKESIARIRSIEKRCFSMEQKASLLAEKDPRKWLEYRAHIAILDRFTSKERERLDLPQALNQELVDQILRT